MDKSSWWDGQSPRFCMAWGNLSECHAPAYDAPLYLEAFVQLHAKVRLLAAFLGLVIRLDIFQLKSVTTNPSSRNCRLAEAALQLQAHRQARQFSQTLAFRDA